MSSTLLCLCCHATCRATLLGNPVTMTSQAGVFFHVWDDKTRWCLPFWGHTGDWVGVVSNCTMGLFLGKFLTQFPAQLCNSQKKKIATPKLPWCNSALKQGSKLNASDFDNLRVRKISTGKRLRVRIIHVSQTKGKNLLVVSPVCWWKKILLAKL